MSITRIIGGSLTKTATGNIDIHATNGNLTLYAAKNNIWHGKEEGIFYHDYDPLHPEDSMSNRLELTLNLFFDGTQNNKTNTESREKNKAVYYKKSNKKDDSYENDFTNIARAYDAVSIADTKQLRVYVEGVGTTDEKSDDLPPIGLGQSAGFWHTGIKDKAKRGCELGAKEIKAASKGKPIDLLTINVFGFSRGAATARHFLSITDSSFMVKVGKDGSFIFPGDLMPQKYPKNENDTKPPYPESFEVKYGYFGRCLVNNGVFEIKKVFFNFVGLYDTVSSHGINHNNDVKDLGLNVVRKALMVLQLSAADEYRENFDLTNIDSAGIRGLELTFPGAHSDIGGSYRDLDEERSAISKEKYFIGTRDEGFNFIPTAIKADNFKKILVKEGWYKDPELTMEYDEYRQFAYLVGKRVLKNTYDKIALNKMVMVSKQFKVKYDKTIIEQKVIIDDPFLARIFDQLTNYSKAVMAHRNEAILSKKTVTQYLAESKQISYLDYIDSKDLQDLRHGYLHWSAKSDKIGLGPRFDEALPSEKRKRQIQNG